MPRTKKPARKEKFSEGDEVMKKVDKLANEKKKEIDLKTQRDINNIEIAFKLLLASIKPEYLPMTVGQLRSLKEPPSITVTADSIVRQASNDDGYLTENSSQGSAERGAKGKHMGIPIAKSRSTNRRSRSADASCRKPSAVPSTAVKSTQRRRSRSVYRTPAYNKNAPNNYPAITPKVTPQTPLTLLRQPRQGEMVVSMAGSPVMVPSCYTMQPHEKANCNILLQDGTMLCLQPKQLRQSEAYIPFSLMDNGVLDQIKTLKENLEKVVKMGERVKK